MEGPPAEEIPISALVKEVTKRLTDYSNRAVAQTPSAGSAEETLADLDNAFNSQEGLGLLRGNKFLGAEFEEELRDVDGAMVLQILAAAVTGYGKSEMYGALFGSYASTQSIISDALEKPHEESIKRLQEAAAEATTKRANTTVLEVQRQ